MAAVIFDLDGTLVDSAPDIHATVNRLLADVGEAPLSFQTVKSFIGNGVPTLVARVLHACGHGPEPARLLAAADGLAGPVLFVGDSEVDAETALAAQVPFLLFTEGYRKVPVHALPHAARFDRFSALPALIARLAAG